MNNNNGFGSPVRTYKKPNRQDPLRTVAVLVMTAIIIAFVVILIMSLTGTGMFADKKGGDDPVIDPQESTSETEDTGTNDDTDDTTGSTDDPNAIKYTFVNKAVGDLDYGLLQMINEENLYKFKEEGLLQTLYENRPSKKSYQISSSALKLKYSVIVALNEMMDDFYTVKGYGYVNVAEAYRDFDTQAGYHENNPSSAVPAGASDYHSGATFRLSGWDPVEKKAVNLNNAAEIKWLEENAHKYGFIFRSPSDKKGIVGYTVSWQIRYVGTPHAEYMYEHDLCLEEYLEKVASDYKYGGEHLIMESADGNTYEVYYVSAPQEGTLKLPVPENRPYTISGDNMSGFIVTVTVEEGEREPVVVPPVSSGEENA